MCINGFLHIFRITSFLNPEAAASLPWTMNRTMWLCVRYVSSHITAFCSKCMQCLYVTQTCALQTADNDNDDDDDNGEGKKYVSHAKAKIRILQTHFIHAPWRLLLWLPAIMETNANGTYSLRTHLGNELTLRQPSVYLWVVPAVYSWRHLTQ